MCGSRLTLQGARISCLLAKSLAVICCQLLGTIASAQTIDLARTAYVEGRFIEAAEIGESLGTSEGYTLAAKSLTIHVQYIVGEKGNEAVIEHAMAMATKAIEVDPNNAEAHLQLTRAVGRYTKTISAIKAAKGNYAKSTRESIERALEIDPELASAWLSLGRWHVGIVARVGSLIARVTFKARKKDALAAFEQAHKLAPDSKEVYLENAIGLLQLDDRKYRSEVRELLQRAIELPVNDAYERILHDAALERLATIG